MDRHQRCRTACLHVNRWALEVQFVSNTGAQEIFVVADHHLEIVFGMYVRLRGKQVIEKIAAETGSGINSDQTGIGFRLIAGRL